MKQSKLKKPHMHTHTDTTFIKELKNMEFNLES